jgi:hypothetical protein
LDGLLFSLIERIRVNKGGSIIAGSKASGCSINKKTVVTFTGTTTPNDQLGYDYLTLNDNLGSKGLAVSTGGSISIIAAPTTPAYARVNLN